MVVAQRPRRKFPEERPTTAQLRNRVVKELVKWLGKAALREVTGPIGTFLNIAEGASWLYDAYPYVRAYFDEPKTLDELRQAVASPETGYNIHHIVEQTPAEQEGYLRHEIDAPEDLARIPTLKHWQINAWYQTPNEDLGWLSPREYLRRRSSDERVRVGREALVGAGVLKP